MTREYGVIGRGFAGWHASGHNVSSSGGTLESYLTQAIDGALVYDAEGAERDAFVTLVISGPMVATHLAPGTVERFADHDAAARMTGPGGLTGAFRTLAIAATSPKFSGLDYVAPDVYESLLRQIAGVKIGHVRHGAVVWS